MKREKAKKVLGRKQIFYFQRIQLKDLIKIAFRPEK